jgi:phosphatidate phosphatase APP1
VAHYGWAARIEDKGLDAVQTVVHRAFDWLPRVEPYTGIGTPTKVRVLCRTLLSPAEHERVAPSPAERGWRAYICLPADQEEVRITIADYTFIATTDRGGYIDKDVTLPHPLAPGWHSIFFTALRSGATARGSIQIVSPQAKYGIVSDIDDTAMVTAVPKFAVAVYNTFIEKTAARQPVGGMAHLFTHFIATYPETPIIYLSNGAWNAARTLRRFLKRWNFPDGTLLLTDFGPTDTGFFRNGKSHKREQLRWLMNAFPEIGWVLIGDDGQSDPVIYAEAARKYPGRVAAIGIRTLSPVERIARLAGSVSAPVGEQVSHDVPVIEGHDGEEMLAEFQAAHLL